MIQLKNYQKVALDVLTAFLKSSIVSGPVDAFKNTTQFQATPYKDQNFGNTPFACLRLPTGGGKTLLAAHSVGLAAQHFLGTDFPLVLWLAPTTAIKDQTLDALQKSGHPYRQALDERFKGQVLILDMADITTIRPTDFETKAVIIIGTFATGRVRDTSIRNFYAHNENFEPHFAKMPNGLPGMEHIEEGTGAGKVKYSFANLCFAKKPLVIVDEAHNARTTLTFETLTRINPACVIEFTATPNTTRENGSNVLFSVSASELRAEEMIKLPIILSEHHNWENAVHDAVQTQKKLLSLAVNEKDYVRPIVLFQAENEGKEVTVDVLKKYLIENERIPEDKIAVATGAQHELDGINLFDTACPVEYIITKQALKEGWDCSFAYVFCSVANISSDKDVEQLLGRVLRMPYAKRRFVEQLNNAYAHVSSPSFSLAAQQLKDKLVDMGFEEMEAASNLIPYQESFLAKDEKTIPQDIPLILELKTEIGRNDLPDTIASRATISVKDGMTKLIVSGEISESDKGEIVDIFKKKLDVKSAKEAAEIIKVHQLRQEAAKSPSQKGLKFEVSQLSISDQEELFLPDREYFLERAEWDLISVPEAHKITSEEFKIEEESHSFKVDIEGKKVFYSEILQTNVFDLNEVSTSQTEMDLILFLDRHIGAKDVGQPKKQEFLRRSVSYLMKDRKIALAPLIRARFLLARAVENKIIQARQKTAFEGFTLSLFKDDKHVVVSPDNAFIFESGRYDARNPYKGAFKFSKHYFPIIADLKSEGEEFDCAQAIDHLAEVDYWVRNVAKSEYAFKFPTSTDFFYPDFVVKLKDGRILVVEYKGEHLLGTSDTEEKQMVGELWARKSGGKCIFYMAVKKDNSNRMIYNQLKALIE